MWEEGVSLPGAPVDAFPHMGDWPHKNPSSSSAWTRVTSQRPLVPTAGPVIFPLPGISGSLCQLRIENICPGLYDFICFSSLITALMISTGHHAERFTWTTLCNPYLWAVAEQPLSLSHFCMERLRGPGKSSNYNFPKIPWLIRHRAGFPTDGAVRWTLLPLCPLCPDGREVPSRLRGTVGPAFSEP